MEVNMTRIDLSSNNLNGDWGFDRPGRRVWGQGCGGCGGCGWRGSGLQAMEEAEPTPPPVDAEEESGRHAGCPARGEEPVTSSSTLDLRGGGWDEGGQGRGPGGARRREAAVDLEGAGAPADGSSSRLRSGGCRCRRGRELGPSSPPPGARVGRRGEVGRGERWACERGRRGRGRGCDEASTRGVAPASEGRGRGDDSTGLGVGVLGFAFRGVERGKLGRHVGFGQR
jgi:hypothetical protein